MKKALIVIIVLFSFTGCKSSKQSKSKDRYKTEVTSKRTSKNKADRIVNYSKKFKGVKYKWGGTTRAGMDCSGLVYESFRHNGITLPRVSSDMAKKGHKINLKKAQKGDLLFFKTGNKRNRKNHVGLVVEVRKNNIMFIHSTTTRGVIISNLNESYWLKAFDEARRVL